jgi:hypothetical protein
MIALARSGPHGCRCGSALSHLFGAGHPKGIVSYCLGVLFPGGPEAHSRKTCPASAGL